MAKKKKNKTDGVHGKLFINNRGETLLCRGRLEFLAAVDRSGSISSAAEICGYSYRKAWSLVERTNRAAGCVIVETFSGGAKGGGARLTSRGKQLVAMFQQFLKENKQMTDKMWKRFRKTFPQKTNTG